MSVAAFDSTNNPNCVEYIPAPAEFEPLVQRAIELVKQIAGDDTKQALFLETADNQIHEAIIDVPYVADETLLHAIGKDHAVIRIVCCWSDGGFDVPSYDFRKKLCEFNQKNEAAEMLLIGDRRFVVKPICVTMPPKT